MTDARLPRPAPRASSARWRSAACTGARPAFVQGESIAVLRERIAAGIGQGDVSRAQAHILLRRQLTPAAALAEPGALQRPAADAPRRAASTSRATTRRTRRSRATGASSPTRPTARSCRSRSSSARSRCCAPTSTRARRRSSAASRQGDRSGPNPYSAYNPTISGDGRLHRLRGLGRQPELRQALRADRRRCSATSHGHDATKVDRPAAQLGRLAVDLQPGAGGRRRAARLPGRRGRAHDDRRARRRRRRRARSSADCGRAAPATATPTTRCCRPTARGWPTRSPAGAWAIRARRARGCRCATCAAGRVLAADRSGTTANPGLSPDGRFVAYVSSPRRGPRGARAARPRGPVASLRIPTGGGLPLDPVVADGGAVVAFAAVRDGRSEIRAWTAATGTRAGRQPGRRPRGRGRGRLVGGPVDLRRRAADRVRLDRGEPRRRQARRHPRDLRARPRGGCDAAGQRRAASPTRWADDARRCSPSASPRRCCSASGGGASVSIVDNAFVRGVQRPVGARAPGRHGDLALALAAVPQRHGALGPGALRLPDPQPRPLRAPLHARGHLSAGLRAARARG